MVRRYAPQLARFHGYPGDFLMSRGEGRAALMKPSAENLTRFLTWGQTVFFDAVIPVAESGGVFVAETQLVKVAESRPTTWRVYLQFQLDSVAQAGAPAGLAAGESAVVLFKIGIGVGQALVRRQVTLTANNANAPGPPVAGTPLLILDDFEDVPSQGLNISGQLQITTARLTMELTGRISATCAPRYAHD